MATLSALRFSSPDGAEKATAVVAGLVRSGVLDLEDAAVVRWSPSSTRPEMWKVKTLVGDSGMNETFWSTLFGCLLLLPLAASTGGLDPDRPLCSLADFGIGNDFVRQIRQRVNRGTSALFLLTAHATVDRVLSLPDELDSTVMSTNLSDSQEDSLRTAFSDTDSRRSSRGVR